MEQEFSKVSDHPKQLTTDQVFAGVNYMEAIVSSGGLEGRFILDTLLKPGDYGMIQHNTSSLFNKFTTFQYSPLNAGSIYQAAGHFIGYYSDDHSGPDDYEARSDQKMAETRARVTRDLSDAADADNSTKYERNEQYLKQLDNASPIMKVKAKNYAANKKSILSNPTALALKEWGANISAGTVVGFQPYSLTDFMFCKNYGKIPNNRLVTLRRYPFPVSDSLRLGSNNQRRNAIPIAQAVTWFGSDTENDLDKLGVFAWDMPWVPIEVAEQEIAGNEITISEILSSLTKIGKGGAELKAAIEVLATAANGSDIHLQELTGYDKKIQDYMRKLYTVGPYWNRIYGPVNVINQSTRRGRGMQTTNWSTPITINFNYEFRSFNGLSPKVAALDLISNFINLTYNDAQFLNQLPRYFKKTGLKFDPTMTELIGNTVTSAGTSFVGNSSEQFSKALSSLLEVMEKSASKVLNDPGSAIKRGVQTTIMTQLKDAIPELISIKSALSDRPIGEWHIVVGNPMNPIFVMGDLIVTNTKMTWSKELGPDDFPTGCTFTVTLKQGKPRDKTSIERMLNAGETKLTSGMIRVSSADDTFGRVNSEVWADIQKDNVSPDNASKLNAQFATDEYAKKGRYAQFRNKFRLGYGLSDRSGADNAIVDKSDKLDDSLLLMYYQREYGTN